MGRSSAMDELTEDNTRKAILAFKKMLGFINDDLQITADLEKSKTSDLQKLLKFYNTVTYIHENLVADNPSINFKDGELLLMVIIDVFIKPSC